MWPVKRGDDFYIFDFYKISIVLYTGSKELYPPAYYFATSIISTPVFIFNCKFNLCDYTS